MENAKRNACIEEQGGGEGRDLFRRVSGSPTSPGTLCWYLYLPRVHRPEILVSLDTTSPFHTFTPHAFFPERVLTLVTTQYELS